MVDTVTSQIYDGARNVVVHLNSVSDGTGQAGVVILDPATLIPNPGTHLVLWRCSYDIKGGGVNIEWDGTPDRSIIALSGQMTDEDFSRWGGLKNDAVAATGLIRITTVGFVASSGYSITLEFKKGGPVGPGLGAFLLEQPQVMLDEPIAAPVNSKTPYLKGEGKQGETLECLVGNWDNVPRSYEFQWLSDGNVAKLDTSSNLYFVTDNDAGHTITCVVTATNAHGRVEASPSNGVTVAGVTPGKTQQ